MLELFFKSTLIAFFPRSKVVDIIINYSIHDIQVVCMYIYSEVNIKIKIVCL